ncbi:putative hydrolase of the HAD superfamily [Spirosomataceae bacterium TFI 002]|nr:putative hydrolase of the HAD superfamily [Spirosomataceae bacterium TFI 002]
MQLYFDLDHTLWDFEANSKECLVQIYDELLSKEVDFSTSDFVDTFSVVNRNMWAALEREEITHDYLRENRFKTTLAQLNHGIQAEKGKKLNDLFLELLPTKTTLIPNAIEILDYCKSKYNLHIISNGFYEVQLRKMRGSGIFHYFSEIVTNEIAGARKPSKDIFNYAMTASKCKAQDAVMIGDSYDADIFGAKNVGMKAIYFAPENHNNHDHHITNLLQLKDHF